MIYFPGNTQTELNCNHNFGINAVQLVGSCVTAQAARRGGGSRVYTDRPGQLGGA